MKQSETVIEFIINSVYSDLMQGHPFEVLADIIHTYSTPDMIDVHHEFYGRESEIFDAALAYSKGE